MMLLRSYSNLKIMVIQDVLRAIDEEISKLQRVKHLIAGDLTAEAPAKRRGRPKGSANKTATLSAPVAKKTAKRVMSAEGKARIVAAQKARWAAQKKAAASPKKAAKKTTAPSGETPKSAAKKTPAKKTIAKKAPAKEIVAAKKIATPLPTPNSPATPTESAAV